MAENTYPNVIFSAKKINGNCTPKISKETGSCNDTMHSELSIRDVKKEIAVPIKIQYEENGFRVVGKLPIKWADYHVKDPSIFLVATVDPIVEVEFNIFIKK